MLLIRRLLLSALLLLSLSSCDQILGPKETLSVIAGSELKDIEPKLQEIAKATGVMLEMHYIGTLDGADKVMSGPEQYDLAWFSHAKYLSLLQGQSKRILAQEKIGLSPVIPAIKQGLARKWGWTGDTPVSWNDIADKALSGELKYAMTDPTASNSGFSTVMGVQAAFSGSSDAFTAADVDAEKLKGFFSGQQVTSGSSGWLVEAYERDQHLLGGLFNYESVLMRMNESGQLREPLVLIHPKEGVVTADYPLILLNGAKREAYQKLVDHLRAPEFQQWMMEATNRRPVLAQVQLSGKFHKGLMLDLPFPSNIDTVNEILFAYLDEHRRPSHSFFVLDVSGSMKGQRIESLKQAIFNLTGQDRSLTGQFARFRQREKVTIIPFNNRPVHIREFSVGDKEVGGESMRNIRNHVGALQAGGGTAIYDALKHAYDMARQAKSSDPERFYSIVLMSDGANTAGFDFKGFSGYYRQITDELPQVRTFPVLFGDSNDSEMRRLAELTGGRVFDSRKHSLAHVFKKIRGYQ
jgi:Ca-activated chloride channel family protein